MFQSFLLPPTIVNSKQFLCQITETQLSLSRHRLFISEKTPAVFVQISSWICLQPFQFHLFIIIVWAKKPNQPQTWLYWNKTTITKHFPLFHGYREYIWGKGEVKSFLLYSLFTFSPAICNLLLRSSPFPSLFLPGFREKVLVLKKVIASPKWFVEKVQIEIHGNY